MISVLWIPALVLAGVYAGLEIGRRQAPMIQPVRQRRRAPKPDPVEQEIQETQEWLGVMKNDTADSLDLLRYRYKWKKNPLLAIGTRAKQLALTAKPHSSYEMARIAKYMKKRQRPFTEGKVLSARRRQ